MTDEGAPVKINAQGMLLDFGGILLLPGAVFRWNNIGLRAMKLLL